MPRCQIPILIVAGFSSRLPRYSQWADQTKLQNPAAVTVTRGALLVIADTGNSRVRQIGPSPLPAQLGGIRSASQRPVNNPQNPRRALAAKKRDN